MDGLQEQYQNDLLLSFGDRKATCIKCCWKGVEADLIKEWTDTGGPFSRDPGYKGLCPQCKGYVTGVYYHYHVWEMARLGLKSS